MKILSICDNKEMSVGLRLVGIEGVVANTAQEFDDALEIAMDDRQVAIVVVAKKYAERAEEMRRLRTMPLIVEI